MEGEIGCAAGAHVRAHDPLAAAAAAAEVPSSVALFTDLASCLRGCEAAVLATGWPEYRDADWATLCALMIGSDLIDGRDVLHDVALPPTLRRHVIGRVATSPIPLQGAIR